MTDDERPLSPHLQVYKPQLTTVLSIAHRATGVLLSTGLVALVYWLLALAGGQQAYARAASLFGSLVGQLLLFAVSYAFFYHLCNGLRHLAWDAGYGFEIPQVYATGWAVVAASLVLTALCWLLALAVLGGGS